jgi:dipeptidyl aminopeptidase/acylaminoacyl peptidase
MIQMAGQYSDQVAYWRRKIGDQADPSLIERSPDHKADKISAPVLLLYSDSDAFVPINQSQLMAESLQKAGKSVQIVAIPNADHGLSRSPARLRVLEEIDKFLQDHL